MQVYMDDTFCHNFYSIDQIVSALLSSIEICGRKNFSMKIYYKRKR